MDRQYKEGDVAFEAGIGRSLDGRFCWRARGYRVSEFARVYEPAWPPLDDPDEWLMVGPFKTARAAERNLEKFERAYYEFAEIEVVDAPDPRTLS